MRRWAAAAVCALLAAGCAGATEAESPSSSGPSTAPAGPAAVPGIEAEAVQLRTDAAVGGRFQVRVTATGDEPFTVTSVALDSPGFGAVPPVATDTEFAPGRTFDLRTPLGPLRCAADADPAVARLTVARAGRAPEELRVPLAGDVLGRLHEAGCAADALRELVDLQVTGLRAEGDELVGRLALARRSGTDEVRATRIARSVLVDVEAELPLVLAGDADAADGEVRFTPATCEPHVLAETKQPFRFPVGVDVAGGTEVVLDLPIPEGVRAQLQQLVERVCR